MKYSERELLLTQGPLYPDLGAGVAKYRRKTREGLKAVDRDTRRAYGAAVEAAILALQASSIARAGITIKPNCASRTWHSDGGDIHKAIRTQQKTDLALCASRERKARTDQKWREMYAAAMTEKWGTQPAA